MSQRIAIIGCGYIGTALGKALAAAGHTVLATTTDHRRRDDIVSLGITHHALRADDRAGMQAALHDRDAVYLTLAAGRRGQDYRAVYLAAAENLVACLPSTSVRRVIYTSSTSVYAQQDGGWVDEDSPTTPGSDNGRVLLAAEDTLLRGADAAADGHRIGVTIVRLSGIYGPGRDPAQFVARSAGTTRSDGDAWLNLVHRDDIVAALQCLLTVPHHGVLCLSNDRPTRRRGFYDHRLAALGLPPVQWRTDPTAGAGKRVCNRRIKALLGMTLRHPAPE